jgi:uncharacterized heparinase superfamily protein
MVMPADPAAKPEDAVPETAPAEPDAAPAKPERPKKKLPPTMETDPRKLVRESHTGPSLAERLVARTRLVAGRLGLDRLGLNGRFPAKLLVSPPDPWPGDAGFGTRIAEGRWPLKNGTVALDTIDEDSLPPEWLDYVHSFRWLRDLTASPLQGPRAALVERVLRLWLDRYGTLHPHAWRPDLTGERVLAWIGHADLVLGSSDHVLRSAVLAALARFSRHLVRTAERADEGLPRLKALCGLIASGVALPDAEARLPKAVDALGRLLDRYVLPDGGLTTRTPEEMIEVMQVMLSVRELFTLRGQPAPDVLMQAIDRMGPALKGLVHGDRRLACFHGGGPGPDRAAAAVLEVAGLSPKPLRNAAHSGYQRLDGGRTVVILDAGPPPPGRVSRRAHAGALAFEFSDGEQRVVVNCGSARAPSLLVGDDLRETLRTTAAHSTVVVADTASTLLRSDGLLGKGVTEVTAVRRENEDGTWVEAVHDGYACRFGLKHERKLFLRLDGVDLRGEDRLEPVSAVHRRADPAGHMVDVRFHLAPGVTAFPTQGGDAAALKLPGGSAWMFRCRGGTLTLAETLVIDADGTPRRASQLVITTRTTKDGAVINWLFQRSR